MQWVVWFIVEVIIREYARHRPTHAAAILWVLAGVIVLGILIQAAIPNR